MPRAVTRGFSVLAIFCLLFVAPFVMGALPGGKGSASATIVIKKGTKLGNVAHTLKSTGHIRSEYLFLFCSLFVYRGRVMAGEYELPKGLSALQIAQKMALGARKVYTLKIVEGYNLRTVAEAIQKAGIMDSQAFLRLSHDERFLKPLAIPSDSLEGYLTPDTYFFSKETEADEFLEKIVQRTFKIFEKEDIKKRMAELGMSTFQVLSLASIIEKEAKLEKEKRLISAVFHNRLRLGMSLDADPTVIYGLGSFNRDLTRADLCSDTPYNTYRMKGLPKGPICSPSRSSIMAALYPEESDVLYFVSRNDGSHVFSKNIEAHHRFVVMYQKNKSRKQ